MPLAKIASITGRAVPVPGDDLDTDQIIPARFMKCVTFDGLGEFLFHDVRRAPDGSPKPHPLNDPRHAGATILVSGNNFGCGSSREHAPQAIYRAGYRAVIAEGFAEIFFGNSIQLGMPCVAVARADRERLAAAVAADPTLPVTIDLARAEVRWADQTIPAQIRPGARQALLQGQWDPIGELLEGIPAADAVATRLGYARA